MSNSKNKLTLVLSAAAVMWSASANAQFINLAVATAPPFSDAAVDVSYSFAAAYSILQNINYNVGIAVTDDETNASNLIAAKGSTPFDVIFFNTPQIPEYLARHYPKLVVGRPFPVAVDALALWSTSVNITVSGLPAPLTTQIVIPDPGFNKFNGNLDVPNDNFGVAAAELLAEWPWRIATRSIPNKLVATGGPVGTTWAAIQLGDYPYGLINRASSCRYNTYAGTYSYPYGGYLHVYEPFGEHHYDPRLVTVTAIQTANSSRTAEQVTGIQNYVAFLTATKDSTGTAYPQGQNTFKSYCYTLPPQFGWKSAGQ
jgi:hypothetical protein